MLLASIAAAALVTAAMLTIAAASRSSLPMPTQRVEVEILAPLFLLEPSPAGIRRQRASLTLLVRATNVSERRVSLAPPTLIVGGARLPVVASAPLNDLPPLGTIERQLRFDMEGARTVQLARSGRATLRIAGQSIPVTVKLRAGGISFRAPLR
jgi:hypothetical protein